MNWAIKIISKTLMTKISHISWEWLRQRGLRQRGSYDKEEVTTKAFTVIKFLIE